MIADGLQDSASAVSLFLSTWTSMEARSNVIIARVTIDQTECFRWQNLGSLPTDFMFIEITLHPVVKQN